ncbi:hypothetical protein [Gemmatimonas sp.]|uniref:hypothetical protein n=1 Tax=Gemmatimonas sp. TaxID=1962908 RepID=UPI00286DE266|nr:hypothetical protein [Gemmatimonas sp.]
MTGPDDSSEQLAADLIRTAHRQAYAASAGRDFRYDATQIPILRAAYEADVLALPVAPRRQALTLVVASAGAPPELTAWALQQLAKL